MKLDHCALEYQIKYLQVSESAFRYSGGFFGGLGLSPIK